MQAFYIQKTSSTAAFRQSENEDSPVLPAPPFSRGPARQIARIGPELRKYMATLLCRVRPAAGLEIHWLQNSDSPPRQTAESPRMRCLPHVACPREKEEPRRIFEQSDSFGHEQHPVFRVPAEPEIGISVPGRPFRYLSARSSTARAGTSLTIRAVWTARAMSSFETPSLRARS